MKQGLMTGGAMLVALSSAAFAQTTPVKPDNNAASAPATMAAGGSEANGTNIRQEMTTNLRQAGFTDVKVMPDSFLVQAKDKSGNPVTMFINPNSMTVLTADHSGGQTDVATGHGHVIQSSAETTASGMTTQSGSGAVFANIPTKDDLSSKVVGLDVYNGANEKVGTIKDIAFDANGVQAYIVAVGGFLGMGDHYVAVQPSAITVSYDANQKKWHAGMNTNIAQLKAAPEYKYSANY